MYNHRARPFVDRYGRQKPGFDGYDCSAYKLSYRKTSETKCASHHISTRALREIVLYTIRNVCKYAIEDRDAFIQKVRDETESRKAADLEDGKKQYESNQKRLQELDKIYQKLYESFALGIITEDRFQMLSSSYEAEQDKIRQEIRSYESIAAIQRDVDEDIESFYSLVEKYTSFEELTPRMLNEFVDMILVHKAEKIDRQRTQTVEVYLNFVGKIDFPEPEKTEADLEQEKIDKYWKDRYWKHKEYELARRKKEMEAADKIVQARLKEERERTIKEFNAEVETSGIENMSVIPERVVHEVRNSTVYAQAGK